jgi:hypothetical protein
MDEAPRIVGVHEAAQILGVFPFVARELIAAGELPPPLQMLEQGPIWFASTVEECARTREERRPPPFDLAEFERNRRHQLGGKPMRVRQPGERLRNA